MQHRIKTVDAQPVTIAPKGTPPIAVVYVTGEVLIRDSEMPLPFVKVFQLVQGDSGFMVQNEIYSLNYG